MFVVYLVTLQLNLPPSLLDSVCYIESHNNITAIHKHDGHGDSIGLCQIKLTTAQSLGFKGTTKDLFDPYTNAYYAGKYLKHQISRYGSISQGVIAYNQGSAGDLTSTQYQRRVYRYWGALKNEKINKKSCQKR